MVRINSYAFDKNSSAFYGESITAESKEEFNTKMKEFEDAIPFSKYYTELVFDGDELTEEQESIIEDYEVDYKRI
jgi:hypothetical protein